jgi:hypothetical protein
VGLENDFQLDSSVSHRFGLYAVIVHTGPNANSGHYFVFARHSNDTRLYMSDSPSAPWMLFNSGDVRTFSWKKMTGFIENSDSNTSYLLFYRRIDDETMLPSRSYSDIARNGRRGHADATFPPDVGSKVFDIDMSLPKNLTKRAKLSDDVLHARRSPSPKAAQSKSSPEVVSDTDQEKIILNRLQRFNQSTAMAPWLRAILEQNGTFLKRFEEITSKSYLMFLHAHAATASIQ